MRRWISGLCAAGALLGSVMIAGQAGASQSYPSTLMQNYFPESSLNPLNLCTYCHTTLAGGPGTVTRPFGVRLQGEGLIGAMSDAQLTQIINEIIDSGVDVDSDGDASNDIEELMAGSDPSDPSVFLEDNGDGTFSVVGLVNIPDQTFGCGAHISRSTHTGTAGALGLMAVSLFGLRRGGRKRRAA